MRDTPDSTASRAHHARRSSITNHRRSGGLAVLVAAAAVALAALSATSPSDAASLAKHSGGRHHGPATRASRAHSTTRFATDHSTAPLEQWAACERAHGDREQTDPTIKHEVIFIAVPIGALANWDPTNATAPCGSYLAAARNAEDGGKPPTHPGADGQPASGWGDNALYVQYANCMRANGYPTFPYPSGRIEPDGNTSTDFNGTGIDPDSPAFLNGNANQTCGKQIGAPAWWINSWGPPGSVDTYTAGTSPNSPFPAGAPRPLAAKPIAAAHLIAAKATQLPPAGGPGNDGSVPGGG